MSNFSKAHLNLAPGYICDFVALSVLLLWRIHTERVSHKFRCAIKNKVNAKMRIDANSQHERHGANDAAQMRQGHKIRIIGAALKICVS